MIVNDSGLTLGPDWRRPVWAKVIPDTLEGFEFLARVIVER